jgi:succinate dehydrogenase / fumarate reductase flavoprotein subunit
LLFLCGLGRSPLYRLGVVEEAAREMLAPFERRDGESPYTIHRDLQETMQNLVGIFRNKEDLTRALEELEKLTECAGRLSVEGSRLLIAPLATSRT